MYLIEKHLHMLYYWMAVKSVCGYKHTTIAKENTTTRAHKLGTPTYSYEMQWNSRGGAAYGRLRYHHR